MFQSSGSRGNSTPLLKIMGEHSEFVIEGLLCQECGTFIEEGKAKGFPRTCQDCITEKIETLKTDISLYAQSYIKSDCRKERETLAQKYEAAKQELDKLLISKCCGARLLQLHVKTSAKGICDNCRQESEPKET